MNLKITYLNIAGKHKLEIGKGKRRKYKGIDKEEGGNQSKYRFFFQLAANWKMKVWSDEHNSNNTWIVQEQQDYF